MDKKLQAALDANPPQKLTELSRFYKGFIFGEFGTGKTVVAGRCIKKRGLFVTTDTGSDSLFNHPELLDKTEVVPYNGFSQLKALAQAKIEDLPEYREFDLIVVDTVSQVVEEYLAWLLDSFKFSGNFREKATPKSANAGLTEQEVTGLPDYHLVRNNLRLPVKMLIKAPVDVLFLAHLREPSMMDLQKGKLVRRPEMPEQCFKLIARECSILGLMEREGSKRTIQFKTDKRTLSKSRIKELDDQTVNADDLPEILQKWKEAK